MKLIEGFDSNYRYILVAARRARQLQNGARPMVDSRSRKACRIAEERREGQAAVFAWFPFARLKRRRIDLLVRRERNRIAGCVSAIINGHIARRYPATMGVPLTIQVDSYDTPRLEIDILLAKMQNDFDKSPEIQEELRSGRFTSAIFLRHRWSDFASEMAKRRPSHRFWHRLKRLFGLGVTD